MRSFAENSTVQVLGRAVAIDRAPIFSLMITQTASSPTAGFSVRSVYYDTIAPVPLPAAGVLLGGGLTLLAGLGRFRRRQAL